MSIINILENKKFSGPQKSRIPKKSFRFSGPEIDKQFLGFAIKVKPNCKEQKISKNSDGSLTVSLTSLPQKGKANLELIKLLGKYFKVSSSSIKIRFGLSSRRKIVEVLG